MESLLLSRPPAAAASSLLSPLRLHPSLHSLLRPPSPPPRRRSIRLSASPGGFDTKKQQQDDEDEEEVKNDENKRPEMELSPEDDAALSKFSLRLLLVTVTAFGGVPAVLDWAADAAAMDVPPWMPFANSLFVFICGVLVATDLSVSDEEYKRRMAAMEKPFTYSELIEDIRIFQRMPVAIFAAYAASTAVVRAVKAVTGLDVVPPWWMLLWLFGIGLGIPYALYSASRDPDVEGSALGWDEFFDNVKSDFADSSDRAFERYYAKKKLRDEARARREGDK